MTKKALVCISILVIAVVGLVVFRATHNSPINSSSQGLADQAQSVFDSLGKGDYQNATKDFNKEMNAMMSSEKLGQKWLELVSKVGHLKKHTVTRVNSNGVYILCQFESGKLWAVVRFDSANRISQFSVYGHPV